MASLVEGAGRVGQVRDHGVRGRRPLDGGSCVASRFYYFEVEEVTRPLVPVVDVMSSFEAPGLTGLGSRLHLFSLALLCQPGVTLVTPTGPNPLPHANID